ncbi:hypothetical protein Esti_005013 [Eimeria stiedai]
MTFTWVLRVTACALLFWQLTHHACAETTSPDKPVKEEGSPHDAPVVDEAKIELARILAHPPRRFHLLMEALPFLVYGKDQRGNYVAFCDSSAIAWDVVGETDSDQLSYYIKYVALFFWSNIDKRLDSSLTVVVNAGGFSLRKVLNGSVKRVLVALIVGLNATVPFVGRRTGRVFLLNAPSFLSPLISMASKLAKSDVTFEVHGKREDWVPALLDYVGAPHLPVEYGGTNPIKPEDANAVRYMKEYVKQIMRQQKAAVKSKL